MPYYIFVGEGRAFLIESREREELLHRNSSVTCLGVPREGDPGDRNDVERACERSCHGSTHGRDAPGDAGTSGLARGIDCIFSASFSPACMRLRNIITEISPLTDCKLDVFIDRRFMRFYCFYFYYISRRKKVSREKDKIALRT
jgi:hypothetical protein